MPLYFFHLHNDVDTVDDEGSELPDAEAARSYAIDQAREMAAESVRAYGHLILDHRIDVTDESGAAVTSVTFEQVVRVGRGQPATTVHAT